MNQAAPAQLPGDYFDGRTSRRHAVFFSVEAGEAVLQGDVERRCPLDQLRVSEPMRHISRRITFPDGAYLDFESNAQINHLLRVTGHTDNWIARLAQSWRSVALCALASVVVVVLFVRFGLPVTAAAIAGMLPEDVERNIGRQSLDILDARLLKPSKLSPARQSAIRERFAWLRPPRAGAPRHELLFRSTAMGPNAFALPSGQIVMTDEMVSLLEGDDDAIMGVLAHELGHLHERHGIRQVIQTALLGGGITVLTGDVSMIVTSLSATLLTMRYSRDAELEADDYAVAMLKENGIGTSSLVRGFERMSKNDKARRDDEPSYFSTHPPTVERIRRIEQAASR